jgi:hypothetical protein
MYEHKGQPVISRAAFLRRLATSAGLGIALFAVSLFIGMVGYRVTEGLSWIDAFLNASMLMGGEGPLDHERNTAGKLFEGFYALYSGLAVISIAGVIFAPVVHRFLHKLHKERHPPAAKPEQLS